MYQPKLSVVIPVHTHREGLFRCINSIMEQIKSRGENEIDLEVVDHSGSAVPRPTPCLWMQVAPTNNMAEDWNRAVRLSDGEWVHLMHDDDEVKPGFYNYILYVLNSINLDMVAVATGFECKHTDGRYANNPYPDAKAIPWSNPFQPIAVVFRRTAFNILKGFDTLPILKHVCDWEFFMRLYRIGKWKVIPKTLVTHHMGGPSETESCSLAEFHRSVRYCIEHRVEPVYQALAAVNYGGRCRDELKQFPSDALKHEYEEYNRLLDKLESQERNNA